MSDSYVLQLGGKGEQFSSGRAVKFEVLDDDTYDAVLAENLAGEDDDAAAAFRKRRAFRRALVRRCIRFVTKDQVPLETIPPKDGKGPGSVTRNPLKLPGPAWVKVTVSDLEMPSGPHTFEKLFTKSDRELMMQVVQQLHDPTMDMLQSAMGELRAVSSD